MSDPTVSRIVTPVLQSLTVALLLAVGHYVMDLKDSADNQAQQIVQLNTTVHDLQSTLLQYNIPQLSSDVAVLKSESSLCQNLGADCRRMQ